MGTYTPSFRIANGSGSDQMIHLELNGTNISGSITIPNTGSYSTQTIITTPNLNLTQGTHTLKLVFDTGLIDLNWMEFTQTSTPTPTPT
jgi:Carbohydrate binding module (family 6)